MTGCLMTEITVETKKNIILIITGGNVDRDFAALWVKEHPFDHCIAVDRGVESAFDLKIVPDLALGDFDSLKAEDMEYLKQQDIPVRQYEPEKDATDTELALEAAVRLDPGEIYILGGTGNRADHMLTTLLSLERLSDKGIFACVIDERNKIYAGKGDIYIEKGRQHGDYVSLAVISDSAQITIEGMKYDLDRQKIKRGSSLCQSNEIMAEVARICVHSGTVLVFESKD